MNDQYYCPLISFGSRIQYLDDWTLTTVVCHQHYECPFPQVRSVTVQMWAREEYRSANKSVSILTFHSSDWIVAQGVAKTVAPKGT